MAPRRGARVVKVEQSVDYDNLTVKEVLCPICRSILIEPVTLPCSHVFCSSCFQGTMENANLVCPLCRLRIGSWLRLCKKENKLINVEYWNAIKRLFPEQIKNKLEGVEDNLDFENPLIQLAKPGELKKEYETQIQKESESFKKERQAEIKASEALIKKLREEEEYKKIIEEEKLRLDEEIARKLAEELNAIEKQKRKEISHALANESKNNSNSKKCGPLDRFLQNKAVKPLAQSFSSKHAEGNSIDYAKKDYTCRILCHDIGNDWKSMDKSNTLDIEPPTLTMLNQQISLELQQVLDLECYSDSSDSIESECRFFKPIDYRRSLPCQKTTPIRVPAVRGEVKYNNISSPKGQTGLKNHPLNSAFAEFGNLSLEDCGVEDKKSRFIRQVTKRKSLGTQNKQTVSKIKNIVKTASTKMVVSPEKKAPNNNSSGLEEPNKSTSKLDDQNRSQTQDKNNSLAKRKLSKNFPESQNKRNKLDFIDSNNRLLATPSSPFRGFCSNDLEDTQLQIRFTRNIRNRIEDLKPVDNVDPGKIKLQVDSDYELAKKLQESFNSSYLTRSSAPRRGIKVTRQATLDSMLCKQSKYKY